MDFPFSPNSFGCHKVPLYDSVSLKGEGESSSTYDDAMEKSTENFAPFQNSHLLWGKNDDHLPEHSR